MAVELSTAGLYVEFMKQVHFPEFIRTFHRNNAIINKVRKAIDGVELIGTSVVLSVETFPTSGMQSYDETNDSANTGSIDMPSAGSARGDQMTLPLRQIYGAIEIPQIALDRMRQPNGAWVDPMANEKRGIIQSMSDLLNGYYVGNNKGILATVVSFTDGGAGNDTIEVDTNRRLKAGMVVDIMTGDSSTARHEDETIVALQGETEILIAALGGVDPAAADVITLKDSYARAMQGLDSFTDNTDTSFQNINRVTNEAFQANVIQNNGGSGDATFKYTKLRQLLDKTKRRAGVMPQAIIATSDMFSAMRAILWPDRRSEGNSGAKPLMAFDTGLDIDRIPILIEDDCDANTVYTVVWDDLCRGQLGEFLAPEVNPETGNALERVVNSSTSKYKNAWTMFYAHKGNFVAKRLKGQGKLTECLPLSEDTWTY